MHNPNLILEASAGQQLVEVARLYASEELLAHLGTGVVAFLMAFGALLMLLAAVGLIRLPDLPTRMHASTKAGSLGAAMIMLAVAVAIPDAGVLARAIAVIAFLLLTAPVAAHVIGRAGYFVGVPLWEHTVRDDLKSQYDYENHTLRSCETNFAKMEAKLEALEGDEEGREEAEESSVKDESDALIRAEDRDLIEENSTDGHGSEEGSESDDGSQAKDHPDESGTNRDGGDDPGDRGDSSEESEGDDISEEGDSQEGPETEQQIGDVPVAGEVEETSEGAKSSTSDTGEQQKKKVKSEEMSAESM